MINILFKMKEDKNVLPRAFQAIVSQEVKEYCNSMNVLKKTSSEELKKLSNASIVKELENHCPLCSASARAVCGKLSKPRDSKSQMPSLCPTQFWRGAGTEKCLLLLDTSIRCGRSG